MKLHTVVNKKKEIGQKSVKKLNSLEADHLVIYKIGLKSCNGY